MAAISGTGGGALTITAAPDATSAPAIPTPAPAPRTEATVSAPAPAKAAKAPQVATANPNGPLDLTQGGSAAAALPATAADGFYVQVSSQRTEDAAHATYKDLQTRYPSILGKYDVSLQQATVPTRGTFYRVRVGPFSATDAQRLCDDLKSAGGDCVLARR
jgi:cell division septation protein DedD